MIVFSCLNFRVLIFLVEPQFHRNCWLTPMSGNGRANFLFNLLMLPNFQHIMKGSRRMQVNLNLYNMSPL